MPDVAPFRADIVGAYAVVRQQPDEGIPLLVSGRPLVTIKVKYQCVMDTYDKFLAVENSSFIVYEGAMSGTGGEPLFRYDYIRNPSSNIPGAHIQVHAHRDALTYIMTQTGNATQRGKRRARSTDVPRLSEIHFPVGGPRFRPCLEDLLEMLISELGVESTPEARESLRRGREAWRRKQIGAVVRDAPGEAVATLIELGYSIDGSNVNQDNTKKLRAL